MCSRADQPAWVSNLKKGVLSAFQNKLPVSEGEGTEETSVSGKCGLWIGDIFNAGDGVSWQKDYLSCEGGTKAVKEIGLIRLPQAKSPLYDSL